MSARLVPLLVAAILLVIPAAPAAAVVNPAGDDAAAAKKDAAGAKKKRKAKKRKKCKRGKVKVRIRKRVFCRSAKKALPKPKRGDPRRLMARSVFARDWSKLRNRRGKRARSLPKLIRKLGRRAPRLLNRVTTRGIARLDVLAASSSASRRGPPGRAWVAAGCKGAPKGAKKQDEFTSNDGGTKATVSATFGAEGAQLAGELSGQGFTVKFDLDFGCEPKDVVAPDCPTAVGQLKGELAYKLRASVEVSKGDKDIWSQVYDIDRKTELEGWTDDDAELDRLDVEDVETSIIKLGGSERAFPPITIRTKVIRRTQVNMRTGDYEPDRSDINVTVKMDGLYGPERGEVEDDIAEKSRAEADKQFRAIVDKAIKAYDDREDKWKKEPYPCARLEFAPAPNNRKLKPGDAGSFTATAIATQGGGSSELDAKLSQEVNATFSPKRAGGQQARFDYDVGSSTRGGKVSVLVHATSKAGVAENTWWQPLEDPFQINKISGNFSGSETRPGAGGNGMISFTGGATFVRNPQGQQGAYGGYFISAGSASFTYSGRSSEVPCNMSGSAFVDLYQHAGGAIQVFPVNTNSPFSKGPHNYNGSITPGPTQSDPNPPMVTLTLSNCADSSMNGEQFDRPIDVQPFNTGPSSQLSPDGIHYNGSHSESDSNFTRDWSWTLTGAK